MYTQIYCGDEGNANQFMLKNYLNMEVVDVKLSSNKYGEIVMVIYKTDDIESVEF